jgi:hypothetical protein
MPNSACSAPNRKDDREERENGDVQAPIAQAVRMDADQAVEQCAKEERGGHARGIDHFRAVAEGDTDDAGRCRRVQSCQRAKGEVALSQGAEGEHAIAHGERDRHGGGGETAGQVVAQRRWSLFADAVHVAYGLRFRTCCRRPNITPIAVGRRTNR